MARCRLPDGTLLHFADVDRLDELRCAATTTRGRRCRNFVVDDQPGPWVYLPAPTVDVDDDEAAARLRQRRCRVHVAGAEVIELRSES